MTPLLYTIHDDAIYSLGYDGAPERMLTHDEAHAGMERYLARASFCRRKRDTKGAFIAQAVADELRDALAVVGAAIWTEDQIKASIAEQVEAQGGHVRFYERPGPLDEPDKNAEPRYEPDGYKYE